MSPVQPTEPMALECFAVSDDPPELVPGQLDRAWMDGMPGRHAYRCLPLNIANTSGWELRCPATVSITWTGGKENRDLSFRCEDKGFALSHFVQAHFTQGIVTFMTGWLFRTPPGWALWAMGPPNLPKQGIAPLTGVIETDWLPYPFTMNWQMTKPGKVTFKKGEPFCFIVPHPVNAIDQFTPVKKTLWQDHALQDQYETWKEMRGAFNARIAAGDPAALKEAWQKFYMTGKLPDSTEAPASHVAKRRLPGLTEG